MHLFPLERVWERGEGTLGSSSGWIPDTAGFTPHQRQSSSDELCTVKDLNKLTTPKSGPGRLRVDRGWGAGLDRLELLTQLLAGEVQVVRLLQIEPQLGAGAEPAAQP